MQPSFKIRVESFWNWYGTIGQRFYNTIEAGRCADLLDEVTEQVASDFPGFGWVFGPGAEGIGHSFTLTGSGNPHFQFLAEYWLSQANPIEGWTFYSHRQPKELSPKMQINIDELHFVLGEFVFQCSINEESQALDIEISNPLFTRTDQNTQLYATYLMLDEVLGEYGTDQWIANLNTVPHIGSGRSLMELRDAIHDLEIEKGWKKLPPTESGTVYELQPSESSFPRSDTIIGSTTHWKLIQEFLGAEGDLENPLLGLGAEYVYVEFPTSVLPQGEEATFRGEIADRIEDLLVQEATGHGIGGAFGAKNSYIDFLLFDPDRGLQIIQEEMAKLQLAGGSAIQFFASEKQNQTIVI